MISNMAAEPLLDERHVLSESAFAELVVWRVPTPVKGSAPRFRYRLARVVGGTCVLRYDNEPGKGDHRAKTSLTDGREDSRPPSTNLSSMSGSGQISSSPAPSAAQPWKESPWSDA